MFEVSNPVTISQRAADEIRQIMAARNIPPDYGLRVGVKGGGCGVSLLLGFDRQKDSDQVYSICGIPVLIDKKDTMYVIGKEVDYYDGETGQGFTLR
jgi:iron-sulfur cluster assembly protein